MSKNNKKGLIILSIIILVVLAFRFLVFPSLVEWASEDTPEPGTEEYWDYQLQQLQESIDTRDLPAIPHTITLTAGHYWVQSDIPGGNCTVSLNDGYGNISGEAYDQTFFAKMGDPERFANVENTVELFRMTSGYISVFGPLTITVDYSNISFEAARIVSLSDLAVELPAGTYTLAEISPENYCQFDLAAISGSGEVQCGDHTFDGIREYMSASPGEGEIPEFHNLTIWDTDTLKISGDLVLRITPITYDYH